MHDLTLFNDVAKKRDVKYLSYAELFSGGMLRSLHVYDCIAFFKFCKNSVFKNNLTNCVLSKSGSNLKCDVHSLQLLSIFSNTVQLAI